MSTTNLGPTYGAMSISILISSVLYGFTSFQTYLYFIRFGKNDTQFLKSTVTFIWILETAHEFLIGHYLYWNLITNYGNPSALLATTHVDDVTTGITALITLVVQCFYTRRIWIMSNRNWYLSFITFALAIAHFGFEIAVMGLTFKMPDYAEFHKIAPYFTTGLALAAAVDITIASSMCYFLVIRRSSIKSTNTIMNKIIMYTISSGLLTSITDIVILICFLTMPNNLVYLFFYGFVNNFYANSLLAMLNSRESLRAIASSADGSGSVALSEFRVAPPESIDKTYLSTHGSNLTTFHSMAQFGGTQSKMDALPEEEV